MDVVTIVPDDGYVRAHRQVRLSNSLRLSFAALLLVACASPSATEATSTTREQPVSTTTTVQEEVTATTQAPIAVTTTIVTQTTTAPDAQDQSPESWAQALLAAANQDDFGLLDPYVFVSDEKRDLFRAFVEFDLPQLASDSSCVVDGASVGCPISFDDMTVYLINLKPGDDGQMFTDLIVVPQIFDTVAPDGAFGSGCSPGPGPLPDGEWLGNIAQRRSDEFDFDLVCLVTNEDVDWELVNESTSLRSLAVDGDVLVDELSQGDLTQMTTTYDNWGTEPCDISGPCAVWIRILDGHVIYISEQFLS
jgi:hypothetical protein